MYYFEVTIQALTMIVGIFICFGLIWVNNNSKRAKHEELFYKEIGDTSIVNLSYASLFSTEQLAVEIKKYINANPKEMVIFGLSKYNHIFDKNNTIKNIEYSIELYKETIRNDNKIQNSLGFFNEVMESLGNSIDQDIFQTWISWSHIGRYRKYFMRYLRSTEEDYRSNGTINAIIRRFHR
ncbi:MAG: hypothetical protein PHR25_04520 [Clostridia bacterium]|nr:hypothetical protein [Clostridia bacterium]MDD4376028.1 hypothetical protein [Clostridia bacterium]